MGDIWVAMLLVLKIIYAGNDFKENAMINILKLQQGCSKSFK